MLLVNLLKKEVLVTWKFIRSDIWATIIPGIIATVVAINYLKPDTNSLPEIFVKSLIYFFLYVYSFVISNQLTGLEEDKLNKPFRPLPANLVTKKGAYVRLALAILVFITVGWYFGIAEWAILWVCVSLFHNLIGHKHWFTKNPISMSLGIFSIIGAAWYITLPDGQAAFISWGVAVSVILGVCGVIQDFRDIEGDRKLGRKTLPIDIGEKKARYISATFCILGITTFLLVVRERLYLPLGTIFAIILLGMYITVAWRIVSLRNSKADHITYMILLYTFNISLLSGIVYI